jgi:hypothetical protein
VTVAFDVVTECKWTDINMLTMMTVTYLIYIRDSGQIVLWWQSHVCGEEKQETVFSAFASSIKTR